MSIQLASLVYAANTSCRMTVDYHQHNYVVTLIAGTLPDAVSLLEKINTYFSMWYAAVIWQISLSWYLTVKPSEAVCFQLAKLAKLIYQGYNTSPALCHNLVHRNLNCLSLPQDISLIHNVALMTLY